MNIERVLHNFGLSTNAVVELKARCKLQSFQPDEIVFSRGEHADSFFYLVSGELVVVLEQEDGTETVIDVMGPGQFFGEIGLLQKIPRTATIRALTQVQVQRLEETDFDDLLESSPSFAQFLDKLGNERLVQRNTALENMVTTVRRQQADLEQKNQVLEQLNQELQAEIRRRNEAEQALQKADARLSVLSAQEARRWGIHAFVGQSPEILAVLDEVRRLQDADKTNCLVLGESGTGKELIARAVHFGSDRVKAPFVAVNCSAIPGELADAEFFGHAKGAFTGATQDRQGYFEQADGGTLFLDEIGDMPLLLQSKLLRALESQCITPLGGKGERQVDVRVVAATNVDLESRISDNSFRRDLYFRLAGYLVRLPPLREHKADVPLLVQYFLDCLGKEMGGNPGITQEALDALQAYDYPGNVRELKNLIEFALISSNGQPIQVSHLHFIATPAIAAPARQATVKPKHTDMSNLPSMVEEDELHEAKILAYLQQHGRIKNAHCQKLLGVSHNRASYLLKKLHREGRLAKQGDRRWAVYVLV